MKYLLAFILSYNQILELVDSGEFSTAYNQTLEQQDTNKKYHFLGYIREQQGKYQNAVLEYYTGIALDSDNDTTYYQLHKNLGKSLWKCGAFEQALIETRKAQKLLENFDDGSFKDKQLPSIHYNLGKINKELGDFEEAAANFIYASEMYKTEQQKARIWNMIGLMSYAEPTRAVEFFDKIIGSDVHGSNLAKALHNKANLYSELSINPIPLWKEAYEIGNEKDKFLALMDMGYFLKDEFILIEAISFIPEAETTIPLYYNLFRLLGDVYYSKGNYEKSNFYVNKYFESNDEHLNWMAESKLLIEKHATMNAIRQFQRQEALSTSKDLITILWQLSIAITILLGSYLFYRYQTKRKDFKNLLRND